MEQERKECFCGGGEDGGRDGDERGSEGGDDRSVGRFGRRERKKNRSEKSAFVVERTEDEVETIDRWVGLVGGKERKKERKKGRGGEGEEALLGEEELKVTRGGWSSGRAVGGREDVHAKEL